MYHREIYLHKYNNQSNDKILKKKGKVTNIEEVTKTNTKIINKIHNWI